MLLSVGTIYCVVDRHASVRCKAVDRGGGKVQFSGTNTRIHHGQEHLLLKLAIH